MFPLDSEETFHIKVTKSAANFLHFCFGLLLSIGHPLSHSQTTCSVNQFRLAKHSAQMCERNTTLNSVRLHLNTYAVKLLYY